MGQGIGAGNQFKIPYDAVIGVRSPQSLMVQGVGGDAQNKIEIGDLIFLELE